MAVSLAHDAIAFLIDLAEQGEIDPWDVKVIEVIDRFLSDLAPSMTVRESYETSLSESGQAFLYASMLVLLKADSLTQAELPDGDAEVVEDLVLEGIEPSDQTPLPPNLEHRIRRRAVAQPSRHRRVTLQELIAQLQTIAAALEDPSPRKRLHRPRPQSRSQAVRAIAQLAHQENLSEMAIALEQFFAEHWSAAQAYEGWLDFNLLLEMWCQTQQTSVQDTQIPSNHDRVGVFWALLLLSAQSKVELAQDEFYQDLKVRPLSVPSDSGVPPITIEAIG